MHQLGDVCFGHAHYQHKRVFEQFQMNYASKFEDRDYGGYHQEHAPAITDIVYESMIGSHHW